MLKIGGTYRVKSAEKLSKVIGEEIGYGKFTSEGTFSECMWKYCGEKVVISDFYYNIPNCYNMTEESNVGGYYWHEDWLEEDRIPDSKLARNLYKNQIVGEEMENGQNYLILEIL